MLEIQSLNEANLIRESLQRMSDKKGILHRAAFVLELVAHSTVGLGEVLQDYAHQASGQLSDIIRASANAASGTASAEDMEVLRNLNFTLKSVKSVLEMTPSAMARNKAEMIGDKAKLSRAEVTEIAHAFLHSADIERLLANENAGEALASLALAGSQGELITPELQEFTRLGASH